MYTLITYYYIWIEFTIEADCSGRYLTAKTGILIYTLEASIGCVFSLKTGPFFNMVVFI
jgi:hypothetical protein